MKLLLGVAQLVHLLGAAQPASAELESACANACRKCLKKVVFAPADPADPVEPRFEQSCRNRLALSSSYLCFHLNCGTDARDAALAALNASCQEILHTPIPPFSLVANYTADDIARLKRITKDDSFSADEPLDEVVVPSPEFWGVWHDTLDAIGYVNKYHYLYALSMYLFWGAVLAFGICNKLSQLLSRLCGCRPGLCRSAVGGSWLKRHVSLPALFGYRSSQSFSWFGTIPPRIQSLTIFAYLAINVAFSIYGYRLTEENFYFPTKEKQILRYVSDRTGIISFACFPIIWLTGVRNNLAIWLTGWNYSTYNNFHRWAARIATVHAIVHSVGYTVLILKEGGWTYYSAYFSRLYWNTGLSATVVMAALLPCSFYWIRRRRYETFLILHVALSLLLLLFMLGHVSIFKGQYDALFWVPVYIWAVDRLTRLVRIIAFDPKSWRSTASAVYNPASHIVRLTVPLDKAVYSVEPGTHYYLMVLDAARCWESHPFTVAFVSSQEFSGKSLGEQVPLLDSEEDLGGADDDENPLKPEPSRKTMTFLVRPYDGFSRRLRDLAGQESPTALRVLVDGPYGHSQKLDHYDHVLFIVGGSGVVTALSYLKSLTGAAKGSIQLHWSVRERAFAEDVLRNEIADALDSTNVVFSVDLYMSSHAGHTAVEQRPEVRQHPRRPNVEAVVMAAAAKAGKHDSLAVVACGPAKMADDSRLAVVHALKGGRRIDYFEESFRW